MALPRTGLAVLVVATVAVSACSSSKHAARRRPTTTTTTTVSATTTTATAGSTPGASSPASSALTLHILSPQPHSDQTVPVAVHYQVDGAFPAGERLHIGYGTQSAVLSLALPGPSGTVSFDDKRFTGVRDLLFTLSGSDDTELAGPSARVTVPDVTIMGRR